MRRFFIGLAGGALLGYAAIRAQEAAAALRVPPAPLEPDPAAYGRLRRGLMLASMTRSLATLAVTANGLGPLVEPRPGTEGESRLRRLSLVGGYFLASALFEGPADYVEGIVLERRYGLTKQSDRAWLIESLQSHGLTLAISLPLVELLAFAVDRLPRTWPLAATFGSIPLLIVANVVVPTFIAPLFNTFEPIEGEFAERIRALAARFGAGDARLLRVDMSRQTEKANAYVTGVLGTKRIVIGDTLLDRFAPDETAFVVAHELGHYVRGDVWRSVGLGAVAAAFIFFGGNALAARRSVPLGTTAGLARLFYAMSLLGTLVGPAMLAFSRSRERAADGFAIEATGDAAAGAAAFTRLRERNLAEDEQPRWMELLFSSHPSLRSRIARLEEVAAAQA